MTTEGTDRALGASYRLLGKLGRGASGEVWRGVDRRTGTPIAAKLLRPEHVEDPELVDRFLRERSILVGLRHPDIVAVSDLVVEGDELAIVMEYVEGGSLREVVRDEGPLPPDLAVEVVALVLDGLAAAHAKNVTHRDIKPDNVLLTPAWRELGPGSIKLTDFGIARIIADRASTSTGLVGTPEYMAPEQLLRGEAGPPADVYAAGILLYELLAGRSPFSGQGTGYAVAHRHVTSEPPPIPVPDAVSTVLLELLDKAPARRPSAQRAAERLRAIRSGIIGQPALPRQDAPEEFATSAGPMTEVRGLDRSQDVEPDDDKPTDGEHDTDPGRGLRRLLRLRSEDEEEAAPPPRVPAERLDLGSGSETMLRTAPTLPPPVTATPTEAKRAAESPPWWRRRWVLAVASAVVIALGVGGFFAVRALTPNPPPGPPVTTTIRAQQQSQARPTGLVVSRVAVWDAQRSTADLTITYAAGKSTLGGPFLEVIPAATSGGPCPAASWTQGRGELNRSGISGVAATCGWAVQTVEITPTQPATATVSVPLTLAAGDPTASLQGWLDTVAKQTDAAVTNAQITSTSYPAQRLTDIAVVAPSRTVSGRTLKISLVPVWPSGADALNPLLQSPPTGDPSSLLVAVAGGLRGVRFSDGCSGALSISGGGLVVTAVSPADECQVNARVGNFTDLSSNTFAITTRGS